MTCQILGMWWLFCVVFFILSFILDSSHCFLTKIPGLFLFDVVLITSLRWESVATPLFLCALTEWALRFSSEITHTVHMMSRNVKLKGEQLSCGFCSVWPWWPPCSHTRASSRQTQSSNGCKVKAFVFGELSRCHFTNRHKWYPITRIPTCAQLASRAFHRHHNFCQKASMHFVNPIRCPNLPTWAYRIVIVTVVCCLFELFYVKWLEVRWELTALCTYLWFYQV